MTQHKNFKRRASDRGLLANFKQKLLTSDIFMVLVIGAAGLLAWVYFGLSGAKADIQNYAQMFPVGTWEFWVFAYVIAAIGMLYIAAAELPPFSSLIVGGWLVVIWSWSFFARAQAVYTQQTGNATSFIYIVIGILILQRSGKS